MITRNDVEDSAWRSFDAIMGLRNTLGTKDQMTSSVLSAIQIALRDVITDTTVVEHLANEIDGDTP